MDTNQLYFLKLIKHPVKFRMFLFLKLPSAFFSGIRVKDATASYCTLTVPFKWFTKNPFRSTYFACLAMAAEASTGLLAMLHSYKNDPPVSMLVVNMEAAYYKKAIGVTAFTCNDGDAIRNAIEQAIATKESVTVKTRSIGKNDKEELVAEFFITWSFKIKSAGK
jgi:hypothetical protein